MIIFIRGLPGVGKTTVSDMVAQRLGWDVVHVDEFKKRLMKGNPQADFIKEIIPLSYVIAFEVMQKYVNKNVIIEETFRNGEFVHKMIDFCTKNNIAHSWFKITRDRSTLVEVDAMRKRVIKNSPEILNMMDQQINAIYIDDEMEIINTTCENTAMIIHNHVRDIL